LGTSRKNIKDLTEDAKRLGMQTEWSASSVAELQTELAKLGFSKNEIKNAAKPILGLATALQANLADAAEVSGAALRAFGLDANETERVVSVMTVAANKSALSFEYIQTSLATVSPVAKAFNFNIEDTMALLGTLADAGFDASTAATATRNIILNLADSNGKLAKSLGEPVKSLDDLVPALIKLRNSGINLNETLELTDRRSVAAFNRFLDGAESIAKLRGELNNTEGELDRIRKEQLETVEGSIKMLNSAWEGLMLSFSGSSGFFKKAIDLLAGLITHLGIAVKSTKQLKAEFQSEAEKEATANAIKQVEDLTKAYEKNGRTASEAREKAVADFIENTNAGINHLQKEADRLQFIIYNDPIEKVRKNAEKALEHIQNKIKLQKVEIEAAQSISVISAINRTGTGIPEDKSSQKPYEAEMKALDLWLTTQKNALKQAYIDRSSYNETEINGRETFLAELEKLEMDALERRLQIAGLEPEKIAEIEAQIKDRIIKQREETAKEVERIAAETAKKQEKLGKWHEKETDEKIKAAIDEEQRIADVEMLNLTEKYAAGLISEEEYQKQMLEIQMKALQEKLRINGLSEEEITKLKQQYLDLQMEQQNGFYDDLIKKIEEYKRMMAAGSEAIQAIEEAETAQTEAEYAKRQSALTEQYNQGIISQEEYNTQKEQLDYEQKSKELEIQKKYADVNFAMQVAQIIATTAQGIITAWATAMTLGPVAGPIAASALSVLLGVTSAAQIAKAKSERDRVKAMTLESPGSGGDVGALKTGQIKLKEGFAEGGSNVGDYTDGGYTGKGGRYEVAGMVPYHHGEYIVAVPEMKDPAVQDHVREIDKIRRKRTGKNPLPEGFAEGGANMPAPGTGSESARNSEEINRKLLTLLNGLVSGRIAFKTNYGVTEYEAAQKEKAEYESKFDLRK
jgi:TP901 family phage tail tape measure protein